MLDPDIHNLLAYTDARADQLGREQGLEHVAAQLGYTIQLDDESAVNHATKRIYLRAQEAMRMKSDLAHELGHALANEGRPSWAQVIRHRHASAPNLHDHLEALTDAQADLLTMPHAVVQAVLNICGLTARAVWVLHQHQQVQLHEALRRIVHHDENARIGGFIARRGLITHAYSYRWRLPVWVGNGMPDPDDDFRGEGVSLFEAPGRPGVCVGLVVVE